MEQGTYEGEVEAERIVNTAHLSSTGRGEVVEGDEVGFGERGGIGGLVRRGLDLGRTVVAKDGRVNAAVEGRGTLVGERANPVVVHGFGRIKLRP